MSICFQNPYEHISYLLYSPFCTCTELISNLIIGPTPVHPNQHSWDTFHVVQGDRNTNNALLCITYFCSLSLIYSNIGRKKYLTDSLLRISCVWSSTSSLSLSSVGPTSGDTPIPVYHCCIWTVKFLLEIDNDHGITF